MYNVILGSIEMEHHCLVMLPIRKVPLMPGLKIIDVHYD